jgi:signal transduction histidine kinase
MYGTITSRIRGLTTPTRSSITLQSFTSYLFLVVGLATSFLFATRPALRPFFLIYWLLLQAAYLWNPLRGRSDYRPLLSFLGKLQLQTTFKLFTHLGAVYLIALWCDLLQGNSLAPQILSEHTTAQIEIARRALNFLAAVIGWGLVLAIWRSFRLERAGHPLSDITQGTYCTFSVIVPAAGPSVDAALALRLQQLRFNKAPRFTRMFLESRPTVQQSTLNKAALALTWPLCPTAVELEITHLEQGTSIQLSCRLRSGLYRFEVFVSPREATALLNFLRTNLVDATDHEMRLANALRKQEEFRHLAVEAQLRMLQTQIEPHFLFNTLANVQQLYRENLDEGDEMLNHLTAYFRGAVEGFRVDRSTIDKEMQLSQRYLAIMKARMGHKLSFEFAATPEVRKHPLPPAMLISLVENAIKHGIGPKMGGNIRVSAVRVEQVVRLQVTDDGAGFSSEGGTGTGLTNLRARLDALYGSQAWLEVETGAVGGFTACIVVPFEEII